MTGHDVELAILAEARNEVGAADHKASMVLAVLGIGFGAVLGGLIAREWTPADLDGAGLVLWLAGAACALGSVGCAAAAVWPRFTVPDKTTDIYFWGHVAALDSHDELIEVLSQHPPSLTGRTRHQLFALSHIVARKYLWVRRAMQLAGATVPLFLLAAAVGY